MSKLFTAVLSVFVFAATYFTGLLGTGQTQPLNRVHNNDPCPGGYVIGFDPAGNPICKAEPTGCPYGDSLDKNTCKKFEPVKKPKLKPITLERFEGK